MKTKKISSLLLTLVFIICNYNNIRGQNLGCGNFMQDHKMQSDEFDGDKLSDSWNNIYKNKEHYMPDSEMPIKTLHVNLNIWQRANGTGNLSNIPQHINRLKQIMEWVNHKYNFVILNASTALSYQVNGYTDSRMRIV